MTYEYHCGGCNRLTEKILVKEKDRAEEIQCPYCPDMAILVISGPAVLTGNMGKQPIDVAIGKDADLRWNRIHTAQAKRDKVRQESGLSGLSASAPGEFKPISPERLKQRTTAVRQSEHSN